MSGISKKNVSNIKRVFDRNKRSGSSVSSKNKIHIAQNRMLQSKLQQNLLLNGQIHDVSRRFFNTLFSVADRIRQKLSVGLMLRASPRTTREEKKTGGDTKDLTTTTNYTVLTSSEYCTHYPRGMGTHGVMTRTEARCVTNKPR